jgi:hypothetical protein
MSSCYNCDTDDAHFEAGKYFEICSLCGGWHVEINKNVDFGALYSEAYFCGDEYLNYELGKSVQKKNFVKKLKILAKHLDPTQMRILEIGSASGEFLKTAKEAGVTSLLGIEISDFARNKALKDGLDVLSPFDSNIIKAIKEFQPNIIVAWDVWEHLESPSLIMKHYLSLGSSDCLFAVTTVDASSITARFRQQKWRQFHPPTHINYPTKKSLKRFCEKNNLLKIDHFHFGYFRPLAEYLCALLGRRKWIVQSTLFFKIPLYLNLFDTQIVVAKKLG